MSENNHCDHYSENGHSTCKTCGKRRFYLGMLFLFSLGSVIMILRCNWPDSIFCDEYRWIKDGNYDDAKYKQCQNESIWFAIRMISLMTLLAIFIFHRAMSIEKNRKPCSHENLYEEGFKVGECNYCRPRFSYQFFKIMYETLGKQSSGFKLNKKMK